MARASFRKLQFAALLFALTSSLLVQGAHSAEPTVHVEPQESDELLANPGMGWQTFHQFADQDKNLQGLPSGSAYFRFYWREVESKEGQIDFVQFDSLLAHARRAGQKLAFRIMCTGSDQYSDVPSYLKEKGCKGIEFTYEGGKHWVPDYTDPKFREAHFRLIRELGRRYDGHADLDLVDIGSVGLWGEWHMSSTSQVGNGEPVPMPPVEERMAIIDAWCQAFPKTSKAMLIGSDEGMAAAAPKGYGWRADCLGDMGGFSKNWNHMDNLYLQQLTNSGALDVWMKAPVAFESCWDMRKWKEAGWNIRHIFDYALNCHASYMNNKSAPIPQGTRPEIERFIRRLGYRLVLRTVDHPKTARPGENLEVRLGWENVGVAPPYRDYRVAVKLMAKENKGEKPLIIAGDSIRGWLPGLRKTESTLKLPSSVPAGHYELSIGVVEPDNLTPAVRLAIVGRDSEGWYPVSKIEIKR